MYRKHLVCAAYARMNIIPLLREAYRYGFLVWLPERELEFPSWEGLGVSYRGIAISAYFYPPQPLPGGELVAFGDIKKEKPILVNLGGGGVGL
jgi:hypothetical protein